MNEIGQKSNKFGLEKNGIKNPGIVYWNLPVAELTEHTLIREEGTLADTGALVIETGEFTGRSPKDKFVVCDESTEESVWWGEVNQKISIEAFEGLESKIISYFQGKDLYVRDVFAGADENHKIGVRVVNETPWANIFVDNMFINPTDDQIAEFVPDWTILCAPGFYADPDEDKTRQHNFTIVNFTKKTILIGGSGYTGEIKKGIFTVLNYILPFNSVLPMHCSANIGKEGDVAIFFGLSGTGKTTLSADPERNLIGDDEHGWSKNGVFNFEGGCYAKCINLTPEQEPQIWNAIKFGALVENIAFIGDSRTIDFEDKSITENTRVSYPIEYIKGAVSPSIGGIPKNIFFLTCDSFGVLPPISKLTPGQAMYQFISGYTAKVAGTEAGITEPKTVFSACFGSPFLPLHPTRYAEMLGEKMKENNVNVWLINTGWTGGPYGTGNRMKLRYTRRMVTAALDGELDSAEFITDNIFGLSIPKNVPDVPSEILNPRNTWANKVEYDAKAEDLAKRFIANFEQFSDFANEEIMSAAPGALIK